MSKRFEKTYRYILSTKCRNTRKESYHNDYSVDPKVLALYHLHNKRWTEELLTDLFVYERTKVLTRAENRMLEWMVESYEEGKTESECVSILALHMRLEKESIVRRLCVIKRKIRLGQNDRVDDWLRGLRLGFVSRGKKIK